MTKIPADLEWDPEARQFLAMADCTSAKAVCVAIGRAANEKGTREVAMSAVIDLCTWAKANGILFCEPYLITLFATVMSLSADKDKRVQQRAEEAGVAMMGAISSGTVVIVVMFMVIDSGWTNVTDL